MQHAWVGPLHHHQRHLASKSNSKAPAADAAAEEADQASAAAADQAAADEQAGTSELSDLQELLKKAEEEVTAEPAFVYAYDCTAACRHISCSMVTGDNYSIRCLRNALHHIGCVSALHQFKCAHFLQWVGRGCSACCPGCPSVDNAELPGGTACMLHPQAASFKDRWQRSHAEMQNLIARQAREKETMQTYAVQVSWLLAAAQEQ